MVLTPSRGATKGVCDLRIGTLSNQIVVKGVTVREGTAHGQTRLFVAMPAMKSADGAYHDMVVPATAEARDAVTRTVMAAYERAVEAKREREVDR